MRLLTEGQIVPICGVPVFWTKNGISRKVKIQENRLWTKNGISRKVKIQETGFGPRTEFQEKSKFRKQVLD